MNDGVTEEQIITAVSELIDPCNILEPMTDDGEFGFGHLRYQEHLSANELCLNRGIDIGPLLTSPWWRSVLVLFARLTDDINYVITDVLDKQQSMTKCKDNLKAMIATKGKADQRYLSNLIEEHVILDGLSQELKDFHDYNEPEWNRWEDI